MWFWVLYAAAADPETASLHVGIHREAGGVYQIASDGAAGQCTVGPSRISCPARGPVTFRWGGDPTFALTGTTVVDPGTVGTAWVLASDESRAPERAMLAPGAATAATVNTLFVRTGSRPVPVPSRAMLDDLVALADHPDPRVRRPVVDALVPWWRHTASDPLPPSAPEVLPAGLVTRLAQDPDHRVRRRLANRLREVRTEDVAFAAEVTAALADLTEDGHRPVTRVAMNSLRVSSLQEVAPAQLSWDLALERVQVEGPPGRAAANTLGRLAARLEPGPTVDPEQAVFLVFQHHTERTWHVWRDWAEHVPFRRPWVDHLLRETVGLDAGLLRHWAEQDPEELAAAITRWEPAPPHSERFGAVRSFLMAAEHPAVRRSLALDPD